MMLRRVLTAVLPVLSALLAVPTGELNFICNYSHQLFEVTFKHACKLHLSIFLLLSLLLLLLKEVGNARLVESDLHPISSKTPAQQYEESEDCSPPL